jgi:hypothetical protein
MFGEVDLAQPRTVDMVRLECSRDQYQVRLKLETPDRAGNWKSLGDNPSESDGKSLAGLRKAAVEEFKRAGVDYILVDDTDFGAGDFRNRTAEWGLQMIDEKGGVRLYRAE